MARPDHPAPEATPDQATPPGEPAPDLKPTAVVSPLPARPAPDLELAPWRPGWRLGAGLSVVVLLFAFLVSSFAARNSDLWMHLAAGRDLLAGRYSLGSDPYAYTTDGAYWVNHSWLFDLGLYALYQALGGPALVVVKALTITALAWLLLRVRRPGSGVALPAACALLALLAMSPRLLLQPTCLSLLLLGLTFLLLWRPHATGQDGGAGRGFGGLLRQFAPLLLLFALWANLDAWFVLGPGLAALFWLGERLGLRDERVTPGWLVPAGFAACLINPHFHRVFSLPPELSPAVWAGEFPRDPRFRVSFLSPWQLTDYLRPTVGLSAAGLAYFALLALGLASFLVNRRALVGWRGLVWVAFALLGAGLLRGIPFFATVAGPITALNLQDAVAARRTRDVRSTRGRWVLPAAHALLLMAGLILVVLTWPGWLQAVPHEHRRVAWEVRADPALERVARRLHRWRADGCLGEGDRVFGLHPDVAHYSAWFAPGEKGFLDQRLPLFTHVAPQYEAVCRALGPAPEGGRDAGEWRDVLNAYGVSVLVLYDPDPRRIFPGLSRLAGAPDEWSLLQVDGQALVFAWKGGRRRGSAGPPALDSRRLAFGAADEERDSLPPAPGRGPQRPPQPRGTWERFLRAAPAPAWESDAATMYLRYFEDRARVERGHALAAYAAGVAGVAAGGPPAAAEQVVFRLLEAQPFLPGFHTRPPELPLLAVRAARRAVAANPEDVNAWLRLGQAYVTLRRATSERAAGGLSPLLGLLRHVQAATALEHALLLDPDLEAAHEALSVLYGERRLLDAALEHRRHVVRLVRRGPQVGERPDEYRDRLNGEEVALRRLEQLVQDGMNQYGVRSRSLSGDPLGRAHLALNLGLARLALEDVLLRSEVVVFGGEGARLQLELMLTLGQAEAVRVRLDDPELRDSRAKLDVSLVPAAPLPGYLTYHRMPAYEWLRFLQAAATGDYDLAEEAQDQLLRPLADRCRRGFGQMRRAVPFTLATELGLSAQPQNLFLRLVMRAEGEQMARQLADLGFLASQRADLHVLGGLLAVERGTPAAALRSFDAAFAAASDRGPPADFATRPLASAYRRQIQAFRPETAEEGAAAVQR
jgi:hypothetical protein